MKKKITTAEIELAIAAMTNTRKNLLIPNVSWGMFRYECDLIKMSPSGYLTEYEIKVSTQDLKRDQEKGHGHCNNKVKYLYFVFPEKMIKHESYVPERAGIYLFVPEENYVAGGYLKLYRKAQENKNASSLGNGDMYQLARLGALRIWDLKRTIRGRCTDINWYQEKIKELEAEIEEIKEANSIHCGQYPGL